MDVDYNELFGLENTGAEVTEPAEPSTETEETGAKEQELADTAEQIQDDNSDEGQDAEKNAKYAAARRRAEKERDLAVAQAKEEARRELDTAIKGLGIRDPFSNKIIETKEEYDRYIAKQEEEKRGRLLRRAGVSDEEFDSLVTSSPQFKAESERAANAERKLQELQGEEENRLIEEELKAIAELNPDIKSLEDLAKMPTYPELYNNVKQRNMNLVEAYKLANWDSLMQKNEQRAKQSAINAAAGKQHLGKTTTRGTGEVPVPAEIREQYRLFNPNATDAEITAHYNKGLKK